MLKGRTAFVTGGTGAIGAAIVRSLAGYGARVTFSFINEEDKARGLERELGGDDDRQQDGDAHPLLETREPKKALVVLVTSDRGLCGGFNANISKAAERYIKERKGDYAEISLLTIGRKGYEFLKNRQTIRKNYTGVLSPKLFRSVLKVEGDAGMLRVISPFQPHVFNLLTVKGKTSNIRERVPGENSYTLQLRAFIKAIRGEMKLDTDPTDAVGNMRVIDTIYEKAGLQKRGT